MILKIYSMKNELLDDYKEVLSKNIDFDKHLRVGILNGHECQYLEVEINTLEELFNIFKGMEQPMGYGGHITLNVDDGTVFILDHWIE